MLSMRKKYVITIKKKKKNIYIYIYILIHEIKVSATSSENYVHITA